MSFPSASNFQRFQIPHRLRLWRFSCHAPFVPLNLRRIVSAASLHLQPTSLTANLPGNHASRLSMGADAQIALPRSFRRTDNKRVIEISGSAGIHSAVDFSPAAVISLPKSSIAGGDSLHGLWPGVRDGTVNTGFNLPTPRLEKARMGEAFVYLL
ncbi:hypothetical protein LshimejAT787_1900150 [Lyophyllum shimeji]|uniref:Uncharacterized protein n=1 Tax=Lyophyllum shimeji TaxID=47721 RepID=A0A9P3UU93_LYOSH|nr:hypothetical protein LshimejAT787_1900150 [Lyophyllum shimeji]